MDVLITIFYILFSICVVYPPAEFVSAGFTIPQIFSGFLGSENLNFIKYHMKRTSITALVHSSLPLGYIVTLWIGGERSEWLLFAAAAGVSVILLVGIKLICWWEYDKSKHPVVKCLQPYVLPGQDWRVVASCFNTEYGGVDKISITLSATSRFIVTRTWLIKVSQYTVDMIKQRDCALVATTSDNHNLTTTGEDEVQYLNIEVIPARPECKGFTFRITTGSLGDLQPRLLSSVRVPEHISLLPTLTERFITVFKQQIELNPVYVVDQEFEQCIGCMQNKADVKLNRHCIPSSPNSDNETPTCQQCNCRVLWCGTCMARWWVARAGGAPATWLGARGSCPVCRAAFCLRDVCPARRPPS